MYKKYIVRLSNEERGICQEVIKKLKGSSQKARRAQILLKADADGPAWPDTKIAEAFGCRVQTIETVRKRLVTEGFELALEGKKRQTPPTPPKLDGVGEARLIALRLGKPPAGYGHWTLQLLADELVALEVVDSISQETVRKTSVSITNTSVTARPASFCSPNRCRVSGKRRLGRGGPSKTGPSKSPNCWMVVMPAVRR